MKRVVITLLITLMMMTSIPAFAQDSDSDELRGVWVATVVNLDYPKVQTSNEASLKAEAIKILDNVESMGLNAVFMQVRPTADAFYKSNYFPWSNYLTGEQGKAPSNGFDPLKFWIDEAHKRGIQIHAWINPYRITKNFSGNVDDAWNQLVDNHIAKKRPELVVEYSNNLYFDPGNPLVRTIVAAGVMEIVKNYDVDGIHFDDYFYPSINFNDGETFKIYGKDFSNINDWRRNNVTEMIKAVHDVINRIKPSVEFGVSPFGIWANKESNLLGSDTRGNQSYYSHYADTRLWVKEGFVDYINPQIYWNIGYSIADYETIVKWWDDVVEGTDVKLYTGNAAYKVGNTSQSKSWVDETEIIRQLEMNKKTKNVNGSVFFRYDSIVDNISLKNVITSYYNEATQNAPISSGLRITNPYKNISSNYNGYYIFGVSDPKTPLYMNNKIISNRSNKGYFGIYVSLKDGVNTFTFTQSGKSVTRTISKNTSNWSPTAYSNAEITRKSVYPKSVEMHQPGEMITFSCNAPIGSKVTVSIDNKTIELIPNTDYEYPNGIYYTNFSGNYKIPNFSGEARIASLGSIVYNMEYKGKIDSVKAPAQILVAMEGAPLMARVNKEYIDSYKYPSSAKGSAYMINKGMIDNVTAMTGDYVRLSFGYWVKKNNVNLFYDKNFKLRNVTFFKYTYNDTWENYEFKLSDDTLSIASVDNNVLTLKIQNIEKSYPISILKSMIFKNVTSSIEKNDLIYKFTLKDNTGLEGYIVENIDGGIKLKVKKQHVIYNHNKPLSGLTILLDPGHGGSDPGALGIIGSSYSEKNVNLDTAFKLRDKLKLYGAKVVMTRETDTYVSLQERLRISRNLKPDLFVSIHANSVATNRDIDDVYGFSVHYKENFAEDISREILGKVVNNLGRNSRNVNVNNFYVVRGTWTPSLLLEMGFMINPREFEYLESETGQEELAREIANGIVEYFKK
ncbi:MAG: family 10 glycosylhydrolase [Clostridiales bacterium]|nr:family 10 glycosylhydrolase [Clostridiales bacterium]